jgi:hypothetical protein
LSNANSMTHPAAAAPSSHTTSKPATETVQPVSTRPTATLPGPPIVGGTLRWHPSPWSSCANCQSGRATYIWNIVNASKTYRRSHIHARN